MSSALTGLNQIPGVLGSVIFNEHDECVVHMMPPPFEPDLLGKVMAELRNALNVLHYLDDTDSWTAIVIRFDAGYLVVRNIGAMTVMVIAQPTLNPAMLSVGFNVAALKLEKEGMPAPAPPASLPLPLPPPPQGPPVRRERDLGGYPAPPPLPLSPMSNLGLGSPPPMALPLSSSQSLPLPQSPQGTTRPGTPAVSQSSPRVASSSTSGFQSDSQGQGMIPITVPDAVGKPVMDSLLRALARHIGPFARLMIKEELTKLGCTLTTLGMSQYEDFISMLGRRLQDPNKRREFMTEAENLARR
jgi:predicted regulator of Ras-like GTPase activity (Roadblock/LC7/MglB family)